MTDQKPTRPGPWVDHENKSLVRLYFRMLDAQLSGAPYNKAQMIRLQQGRSKSGALTLATAPLAARSKQSIEFKLMNATAAHQALDPNAETMHEHGYRALPNMQKALKDAMSAELEGRAAELADSYDPPEWDALYWSTR